MTARMTRPFLPLSLVALALLAVAPAWGQAAVSALKGHDTKAPLDIEADRIEVQDRADRALFTGNVHVRQGNMALDAARLRVAYRNAAGSNLEVLRVDADGGMHLKSPSEDARSDSGVYDVERRIVTMVGGVRLNRGQSTLTGQRLVIDLDSGRSTLDGGAVRGESGGRVTGRFVVPQRDNP